MWILRITFGIGLLAFTSGERSRTSTETTPANVIIDEPPAVTGPKSSSVPPPQPATPIIHPLRPTPTTAESATRTVSHVPPPPHQPIVQSPKLPPSSVHIAPTSTTPPHTIREPPVNSHLQSYDTAGHQIKDDIPVQNTKSTTEVLFIASSSSISATLEALSEKSTDVLSVHDVTSKQLRSDDVHPTLSVESKIEPSTKLTSSPSDVSHDRLTKSIQPPAAVLSASSMTTEITSVDSSITPSLPSLALSSALPSANVEMNNEDPANLILPSGPTAPEMTGPFVTPLTGSVNVISSSRALPNSHIFPTKTIELSSELLTTSTVPPSMQISETNSTLNQLSLGGNISATNSITSTGMSCSTPVAESTSGECASTASFDFHCSEDELAEFKDNNGTLPEVYIKITLKQNTTEDFCSKVYKNYTTILSVNLSKDLKPDIKPEQIKVENICNNTGDILKEVTFRVAILDHELKHDKKLTELSFIIMRYYWYESQTVNLWEPDICYTAGFPDNQNNKRTKNSSTLSETTIIAAITISAVAGTCLFMLCILLAIMRHRMITARECTPTTLDGLSLSSFTSSFRRKKARHSLRSFLNEAFNDPEELSNPVPLNSLPSVISNKEALEEEFKRLPMNMPRVDEVPPGVEMKNRYANVIPIPETRVRLTKRAGDDTSDYINANFVRGYKGKPRYYIACQAPLPETVEDFWRMIWEYQCKVIIMVTACEENGVQRCSSYFPDNTLDCHKLYGDYQVTLQSKDVRQSYTISTLKLHDLEKNLFREVFHFWYTAWPPQGVPEDVSSIVRFLLEARPYIIRNAGPTVVHCSPGTGRTGVILALDVCMTELEEKRRADVPRTVFRLRQDRGGAVQTKDQYALIYEALYDYSARLVNQSHRSSVMSVA